MQARALAAGEEEANVNSDHPLTDQFLLQAVRKERLFQFRDIVSSGHGPVLVGVHDYPDPDCLASALGLKRLLESWEIPADIADGRGIGRAENKAMAGLLQIQTLVFNDIDVIDYRGAILADTQPSVGNNSLPPQIPVLAVFDHHAVSQGECEDVPFVDVRADHGATSTLVFDYLEASGMPIDPPLATALYLGIRTDTESLERDAHTADVGAVTRLLPVVDMQLVRKITRPPLSDDYFRMLETALKVAVRYDQTIVAELGELPEPDYLSTVSELLLRAKNSDYALSVGTFEERVHLSLRVEPMRRNAGELMRQTLSGAGSGGGHALAAGGMVAPEGDDLASASRNVVERFLAVMNLGDVLPRLLCARGGSARTDEKERQ